MLKDIFFMIKMVGVTVAVVLLLQFKVGQKTVDESLHSWIADSVFVDFIQHSVEGGVTLTKAGYKKIHSGVSTTLAKFNKRHKKEERGFNLHLKRYNEDDEDSDSTEPTRPDEKLRSSLPQHR
jgi:hypothetical protein